MQFGFNQHIINVSYNYIDKHTDWLLLIQFLVPIYSKDRPIFHVGDYSVIIVEHQQYFDYISMEQYDVIIIWNKIYCHVYSIYFFWYNYDNKYVFVLVLCEDRLCNVSKFYISTKTDRKIKNFINVWFCL